MFDLGVLLCLEDGLVCSHRCSTHTHTSMCTHTEAHTCTRAHTRTQLTGLRAVPVGGEPPPVAVVVGAELEPEAVAVRHQHLGPRGAAELPDEGGRLVAAVPAHGEDEGGREGGRRKRREEEEEGGGRGAGRRRMSARKSDRCVSMTHLTHSN